MRHMPLPTFLPQVVRVCGKYYRSARRVTVIRLTSASPRLPETRFAMREQAALDEARQTLAHRIELEKLLQFLFFEQWSGLKAYCRERGISIIGDAPIFVAFDSADVWTHPEMFKLDSEKRPIVVAGVPPDYFSRTGQLWGNPIYNWDRMRADGFRWWVERLRTTLQTV